MGLFVPLGPDYFLFHVGEIVNQAQEVQSPIQDKAMEKQAETHINQKERILKAAWEKQQVTCKGNPIHLIADLSAETAGQKGMAGYI